LNLYGSGCGPVDWLRPHPGNSYIEFMITTNPSYINGIYGILNQDGSYVDWNFNGQTMVRPTLYLEYDVKVVDGNGSKANPYILEETPKTISDEVISKENDSNYTSSQDGSIYKVSYQNGYRYAGKDPDNYVTFNGESAGWRIIGTFNGDEIGLNGGEYYTKIVRAESIGQMPYDCDDHNGDGECSSAGESECDWENATLQRYLNGNYLNSITKSNMIATEALWHLKGGTPDDKNAPDWYLTERFSGVPGYRDGEEESAAETFRGAIGLMYPSDVGYSMYSTTCDNSVVGTYSTEFIQCEEDYCTGCANDTWLFNVANGYNDFSFTEWLLTPFYGDRVIASFGSMGIEFDVETFWPEVEVRPTLYLKSDVKITGGTGKKTDPYILNY